MLDVMLDESLYLSVSLSSYDISFFAGFCLSTLIIIRRTENSLKRLDMGIRAVKTAVTFFEIKPGSMYSA